MIKRIKSMKIRTKFACLIVCAGFLSFLIFNLLWLNKWSLVPLVTGKNLFQTQLDDAEFMEEFCEQAKSLALPSSLGDTEGTAALAPLFELADAYTAIYIYDTENDIPRALRYAPAMDENAIFRHFFYLGYRLSDGEGEDIRNFHVAFRNGSAFVVMVNYSRALFLYPYLLGCLCFCTFFFLFAILFFIGRKMKSVIILEHEVLSMASGDLSHPVAPLGGDEIGILAQELDHLRETLNENIAKEQESRQTNQDLITALSHDLRTPLTILNGYLEVLSLKRNPEAQEEYLARCLQKTADIRELTDRMFEYALVPPEDEMPELTWLSTDFIRQSLSENCDFIRLAGFSPELLMSKTSRVLESDKTMLKRIFNNLFSNILKYGDKSSPVTVSGKICGQSLTVTISNAVKQEHTQEEGTNIGLRSVQKMMRLLGGALKVEKTKELFTATLSFPLK